MAARDLPRIWEEYERLQAAGEDFDAYVSLGEILNHASERLVPVSPDPWMKKLAVAGSDEAQIARVSKGMAERVARIDRILSFGDTWEYEELMLVMSLRGEIELVAALLRHLGSEPDSLSGLEVIDDRIREVGESRQNKRHFHSVLNDMAKRWPISLVLGHYRVNC